MAFKLKPNQVKQIVLATDMVLLPVILIVIGTYLDAKLELAPWITAGSSVVALLVAAMLFKMLLTEMNKP